MCAASELDQLQFAEPSTYPGVTESSITTTSSILKTAAVRAIWPASAVASSSVCATSITDAATATETVCLRLRLGQNPLFDQALGSASTPLGGFWCSLLQVQRQLQSVRRRDEPHLTSVAEEAAHPAASRLRFPRSALPGFAMPCLSLVVSSETINYVKLTLQLSKKANFHAKLSAQQIQQ